MRKIILASMMLMHFCYARKGATQVTASTRAAAKAAAAKAAAEKAAAEKAAAEAAYPNINTLQKRMFTYGSHAITPQIEGDHLVVKRNKLDFDITEKEAQELLEGKEVTFNYGSILVKPDGFSFDISIVKS